MDVRIFLRRPLLKLVVTLTGVLPICGCYWHNPAEDKIEISYNDVANARERFIELFPRSSESVGFKTSTSDAELHALYSSYHVATTMQPARRGSLAFVVLDEQGAAIPNVTVESFAITGLDARFEPRGQQGKLVTSGLCKIRWHNGDPLEFWFSGSGYRSIHVSFYPRLYLADRYRVAREDLEEGYVLAPAAPGGPVRIVMPEVSDWNPPLEKGFREDNHFCVWTKIPRRAHCLLILR